jgi:hypothetical protein
MDFLEVLNLQVLNEGFIPGIHPRDLSKTVLKAALKVKVTMYILDFRKNLELSLFVRAHTNFVNFR